MFLIYYIFLLCHLSTLAFANTKEEANKNLRKKISSVISKSGGGGDNVGINGKKRANNKVRTKKDRTDDGEHLATEIASKTYLAFDNENFKLKVVEENGKGDSKSSSEKATDCAAKGGKMVDYCCIRIVEESLIDYNDARTACIADGGDLWFPDIANPYLFDILFNQCPEFFDNAEYWIGVRRHNNQITSVTGVDVTNNPLITLSSPAVGTDCFTIGYSSGIGINNYACNTADNANIYYVCEYDVEDEDDINENKYESDSSFVVYGNNKYGD